jgi:hypothetical protein
LKQHIVNVHIQSQGVACSVCEKVVKNKWYLRKHLVTAHGAPLKRAKVSGGESKTPDQLDNLEKQSMIAHLDEKQSMIDSLEKHDNNDANEELDVDN